MAVSTLVSLGEIRAGLTANLEAAYMGQGVQISAYPVPEPTPPTLHVIGLAETEFDATMMRGSDELIVTVEGLVLYAVDEHVEIIDDWLVGPATVKDALEADKSLGGIVGDVDVRSTLGLQRLFDQTLNNRVLVATWRVRVFT